jgi:CrcB protein
MLGQILPVAAGGAIGAVARHLVSVAAERVAPGGFPAGTLIVNVVGCLAVGYIAGLELQRADAVAPGMRLFLVVGICGGFTTFSAFGLETAGLVRVDQLPRAILNVAAHLVAGLAAVWAGIVLSRLGG